MKRLHVAVVHRQGIDLGNRLPGWWSYAVPEFTWEATDKAATLKKAV